MARASGRIGVSPVIERFEARALVDARTGARYRIAQQKDAFRLDFERAATEVHGARDLKWFIGSGAVGRSYAFALDGFLFQAPASWYSSASRWGLSPGFAGKPGIELARPIEPACLFCHSSRVQHVAGTQNRYRDPPFLEAGVSCERCHGPGRDHVEAMRAGRRSETAQIVNPGKLAPARRDSICQQCHLTGAVRVPRSAAGPTAFRPGDLLSDHVAVFVRAGASGERAATDHAEQLSNSRCQQVSGAKLWCGSCHDAHSQPAPDGRVAFYRQACLNCHAAEECSTQPSQAADCASCHMPKGRSREGEHVVYTDHTISRRPRQTVNESATLRPFWKGAVPERDLALAATGDARRVLRLADRADDDIPLLVQLAQAFDAAGESERAIALYERVLRLDPLHPSAANLAVYRMRAGRVQEAISLWEGVFDRNPALSGPGINLALAHLQNGNAAAAEAAVLRVLRFHPDLEPARRLLAKLRSSLR